MSVLLIAGTLLDSESGRDVFYKHGLPVYYTAITKTQQEQNLLQGNVGLLNKELVLLIKSKFQDIKFSTVVIYCNSMSFLIDFEYVNYELEKYDIKINIISTINIFERFIENNKIAILTANCQALHNLEKYFASYSPNMQMIGISAIDMVYDIEDGIVANEIIKKHSLVDLITILQNKGCNSIIFACTHFNYLFNELNSNTSKDKSPILYDIVNELVQITMLRINDGNMYHSV